jgi:hypothetical protein
MGRPAPLTHDVAALTERGGPLHTKRVMLSHGRHTLYVLMGWIGRCGAIFCHPSPATGCLMNLRFPKPLREQEQCNDNCSNRYN